MYSPSSSPSRSDAMPSKKDTRFSKLKRHLAVVPYIASYTKNGGLHSIPFPAYPDSPNVPIPMNQYKAYIEERAVPRPRCFCEKPAVFHVPRSQMASPDNLGAPCYMCPDLKIPKGSPGGPKWACPFFINVKEKLEAAYAQNGKPSVKVYHLRSGKDFPTGALSDAEGDTDSFADDEHDTDDMPAQTGQPLHGRDELIGDFSRFQCPLPSYLAGKRRSEVPIPTHAEANDILLSLSTHGISFEDAVRVLDNCGACKKIFTSPALNDHLCAEMLSAIDSKHSTLSASPLKRKFQEAKESVTPSLKKIKREPEPEPIASSSRTPSSSQGSRKCKVVTSEAQDKNGNTIEVLEFVTDNEC